MVKCTADVAATEPDPEALRSWHQSIERTRGSRSERQNSSQHDRCCYILLEALLFLNASLLHDGAEGKTTASLDRVAILDRYNGVRVEFDPGCTRETQ